MCPCTYTHYFNCELTQLKPWRGRVSSILQGPSMFAVKAKLYRVLYNQSCTARQCSPLRRKVMECSIINPALSLLMKHLVISQTQKSLNFSALGSPHGSLVSIGQHFVTTRVVHIPKRTETIGPKRTLSPNRLCGPCIAAIAGFWLCL